MAYSAPELLLIGAAQHLVLETSHIVLTKEVVDSEFCRTMSPEDNAGWEYDLGPGW